MIGRTISHYKILEELGAGGMGVVYKAEDTRLKRIVALKFLPPHSFQRQEEKERFFHEAQAAAALHHPNVCTIYEIDQEGEHTFIAMAFVAGESLQRRIERGPVPLGDALRFLIQLCDALEEAHKQGIVHRDIKPANVMISERGQAVLTDFGIAKLRGRTKLTKSGSTVGTVFYMSPEQAKGGEVDARSDIWSLGVVLYEMVTGRVPFRGDHEAAIVYSILHETPPPVTSLRSDVPMDVERIVAKATAKNPAERYQHIEDMRVDLKVALDRIGAGWTARPAGSKRTARRTIGAVAIGLVAVAAVLGGGRFWLAHRGASDMDATQSTPRGADVSSIAVLPLESMSEGNANDFFADGMTEELITQLAQIHSLRVISRTSVMRFKGTTLPLTEIAKQLGVSKVVEGSVLLAGNKVRVTTQLIDGATDQHLWAESYESDLGDVLGLQRRVAEAVAGQIRAVLTPEDEVRLRQSPTVDRETYSLYLQARYQWNKRTPEALDRAIDLYKTVVGRDSTYAPGYTGLAECYVVLATWGWVATNDVLPRARALAEQALTIDPTSASAYAVLGDIASEYEWDWRKAEENFRKAIALNPNDATAHQWYGEFLVGQGRGEEALHELDVAEMVDPLSVIIHSASAEVRAYTGRFDEALAEVVRARELDPNAAPPLIVVSGIYTRMGRPDDAARSMLQFQKLAVASLGPEGTVFYQDLENALRTGGSQAYWREVVGVLHRIGTQRYVPPMRMASMFGLAGETDSALVWIDKAYKEKGAGMAELAVAPGFILLHGDPRFQAILKRVGLDSVRIEQ